MYSYVRWETIPDSSYKIYGIPNQVEKDNGLRSGWTVLLSLENHFTYASGKVNSVLEHFHRETLSHDINDISG